MLTLFFDTETTGIWHKDLALDHEAQPNMVQLAALLVEESTQKVMSQVYTVIKPEGWVIPVEASNIHGINDHRARSLGVPLMSAMALFVAMINNSERVAGHNLAFDIAIVERSLWQIGHKITWPRVKVCTMLTAKDVCKIPSKWPNSRDPYKWPTLSEAYQYMFSHDFENAHDALGDITATMQLYYALKQNDVQEVSPRLLHKPASRTVSGLANPAADTGRQRNAAWAKWVVENIPPDKGTDWEKGFLADRRKDVAEKGEQLRLTDKQWSVLESMADRYIARKAG